MQVWFKNRRAKVKNALPRQSDTSDKNIRKPITSLVKPSTSIAGSNADNIEPMFAIDPALTISAVDASSKDVAAKAGEVTSQSSCMFGGAAPFAQMAIAATTPHGSLSSDVDSPSPPYNQNMYIANSDCFWPPSHYQPYPNGAYNPSNAYYNHHDYQNQVNYNHMNANYINHAGYSSAGSSQSFGQYDAARH